MKEQTQSFAEQIARIASDKKAEKTVIVDVDGLCSYADALVVCHGRSTRQAQTIATNLVAALKKEGQVPLGVEGQDQGNWILIDYADVIVHIFYEPVRKFYDIESIWPDAKKIEPEFTPVNA